MKPLPMTRDASSVVHFIPARANGRIGLQPVPVLPETLLLLELEVQRPCVDLRQMSELVLGDVGATIQVFRLARREYGVAKTRPNRIEDCIADLGLDRCMEAISELTVAGERRGGALAETWSHSREIAQYSRVVAEEMPDVNPEDAYLVGLMHSIGMLPSILKWAGSEASLTDTSLIGLTMADEWSLPRPVLEFFSEMQFGGSLHPWEQIIQAAHQRAIRSSINCPFEKGIRPLLYKDLIRTAFPLAAVSL
jgi:hypothetical protein